MPNEPVFDWETAENSERLMDCGLSKSQVLNSRTRQNTVKARSMTGFPEAAVQKIKFTDELFYPYLIDTVFNTR